MFRKDADEDAGRNSLFWSILLSFVSYMGVFVAVK
jgi:hypothetical protein